MITIVTIKLGHDAHHLNNYDHLIFCNAKVLTPIMVFSSGDSQPTCDFSISTFVNHIFPGCNHDEDYDDDDEDEE